MRGVDKFLQPFLEDFDKMFDTDSIGGSSAHEDEIDKIKNAWDTMSPELSEFIRSLVESFGVASDLTNKSGELSGLQRGIQGVTEETAHIIEGYLNSIRFFVAEKYRVLSEFVSSFSNPEMENPLVAQLRIIATQTSNIHDLLNSLTAPHPTLDGRGLKVVM